MKLQLTRLLSIRYRTHLLVLTMHFSKINTQVTEVGTNLTYNKQIASPQANQKFVKRTRHLFFLVVCSSFLKLKKQKMSSVWRKQRFHELKKERTNSSSCIHFLHAKNVLIKNILKTGTQNLCREQDDP